MPATTGRLPVRRRDLALLRLVAQRLAGPAADDPAGAVARLVAVQGQDHPGAVASVALRTRSRSRAHVVAALDAGEVVTTWPMRGTLHLVEAADLRWLLTLGAVRIEAAAGTRRAQLGLTPEHLARGRQLTEQALTGGRRLTRDELFAVWEAGGLSTGEQRGAHLARHLAQTGVVCLGPVVTGRQAFVLVEEWLAPVPALGHDDAVDRLVLGYYLGHGPASVRDLVRWAGVTVRDVRAGLERVGDRLLRADVDGEAYWMDPEVPDLLAEHRRAARGLFLLPGFDEFLLGYADRSACLPPEFADRIAPGGNGVFRPTVVHAGQVLGTWRVAGAGKRRRLEATPFTAFPPVVERGLDRAWARWPGAS